MRLPLREADGHAAGRSRAGKEIHAVNPDLAKFKARGGKLLIYHGWSDGGSGGAISALNTISYYESVLKHMGPNQENWLRLFMVPGMAHCGGGTGPNQFNALTANVGVNRRSFPNPSQPLESTNIAAST